MKCQVVTLSITIKNNLFHIWAESCFFITWKKLSILRRHLAEKVCKSCRCSDFTQGWRVKTMTNKLISPSFPLVFTEKLRNWAVNYTGTQCFKTTLSYLMAPKHWVLLYIYRRGNLIFSNVYQFIVHCRIP